MLNRDFAGNWPTKRAQLDGAKTALAETPSPS
jgi:hypothetical protein